MRVLTFFLVLPLALLAGCPSHTQLPATDQTRVLESVLNQERSLAVSCYTGPFFRDARFRLLSDQPPETLDLLEGPRGKPLAAGRAEGVIAAGTRVQILDVQFPTARTVTGRSLLTPRYFTWVLVKVPGHELPHVLVIRDDPPSHDAFQEILARHFTTEDVAARLAAWPDGVRAAVAEKRLTKGMSPEAVTMAWGYPLEMRQSFREGERVREWTYEGGRTVTIVGESLTEWSEPAADDAG